VKTQREIFELCDQIRETSFELQRYLRHGHLEKVYENGLANRLQKNSIHVEQQHPLKVFDLCGYTLDCATHEKEKTYYENTKKISAT